MRPLTAAVVLFVIFYAISLGLYDAALGAAPANAGMAWHVWRFVGAGCLSSTIVELVMLTTWLWQTITRRSAAGGVPLRLRPRERWVLDQTRPTVAMLMPAHKEASTPEDRDALAIRIY